MDHSRPPGASDDNGIGPYMSFVDSRCGRRSPNSVEGFLENVGAFAAGATRAHGWRRFAAKVIVIALLLPIAATVLWSLWNLLVLLLG